MPELTQPSPLLTHEGKLLQTGWSRKPLLETNPERLSFYPRAFRAFQKLRVKRWDYYAVFTPKRFFSATLADIGYAGNVFVYAFDYTQNRLHEEGKLLPPGRVALPHGSEEGRSVYQTDEMRIEFQVAGGRRLISVDWPAFDGGKGIRAELGLSEPSDHESMNLTIPFDEKRFYFNRKINALPAEGILQWGDLREELSPETSLGQLDWGYGIWPYRSFWNWASASGFLFRQPRPGRFEPERITFGINLGQGFGDLSAATENAVIINGRIHKLGKVTFAYYPNDFMRPWLFSDDEKRLDLMFTPFHERVAKSNFPFLSSEVHQLFGKYKGRVVTDEGYELRVDGITGFAEEHRANW